MQPQALLELTAAWSSFVGVDSCMVSTAEWLQQSLALRPNAAFAHVHVASIQHADDTTLLCQIDCCGTTMTAHAPRNKTISKTSVLSVEISPLCRIDCCKQENQ